MTSEGTFGGPVVVTLVVTWQPGVGVGRSSPSSCPFRGRSLVVIVNF